MLIENGYGKTFFMRSEDYINLTDEEFQYIISQGYGTYIDHPFAISYSSNDLESKLFFEEELDDEEIYNKLETLDEKDLDLDLDLEIEDI